MFHRVIKKMQLQNVVFGIHTDDGVWVEEPKDVNDAILRYYQKLLGSMMPSRKMEKRSIVHIGPLLTKLQTTRLLAPFTGQEVRDAIWSILGDKAPGPDGYGSQFHKGTWHIIGRDGIEAVLDFFYSRQLLTEINSTTITLIPKVTRPGNVSEFRPISYCNVSYKCIRKLLCSRMREVLPDIIMETQGAFVHSRYIAHNIMICQDIMRQYGRSNASPSCMLNIDMRNVYGIIEWGNLEEIMLVVVGFPTRFTHLIMVCVTSPKFSLMVNGSMYGHFSSKRGLRQGDPLSPLLFVVCMKYLSRIIKKISMRPDFSFHPKCAPMQLTHLCFADDLILCSKGKFQSVLLLLQGFKIFSESSGLQANDQKSAMYYSGMLEGDVD